MTLAFIVRETVNPIRAGRYRQRLYLQVPAYPEVFDTFAQPIQTWTTLGIFWGSVTGLRGQELQSAKQIKAQATLEVHMRYQGSSVSMSPEKRIVIGDRMAATATVSQGSTALVLSAALTIVLNSWVVFPYAPGSLSTPIGDATLQVYQVQGGNGTSYTISPVYGDVGGSGLTVSSARFIGLVDTTNIEERNREYILKAFEIQQPGPI
jgi:head-tail adaptor